MDDSLAAKLVGLKPIPAITALQIVAPFLLVCTRTLKSSERVQTIHGLMTNWYGLQPKIGHELLARYTNEPYPDVCFSCGSIFSKSGNNLRRHCNKCKSHDDYVIKFVTDIIWQSYSIHPSWIECVFSQTIYNLWGQDHVE